ncbi:hypothetical protein [Streptomyces sp. PTD5-9]
MAASRTGGLTDGSAVRRFGGGTATAVLDEGALVRAVGVTR